MLMHYECLVGQSFIVVENHSCTSMQPFTNLASIVQHIQEAKRLSNTRLKDNLPQLASVLYIPLLYCQLRTEKNRDAF